MHIAQCLQNVDVGQQVRQAVVAGEYRGAAAVSAQQGAEVVDPNAGLQPACLELLPQSGHHAWRSIGGDDLMALDQ